MVLSMGIVLRDQARILGLKKYFTGRPCKNGHLSERNTYNGACIACGRAATIKWYRDDPEHQRIMDRKFKAKNREKLKIKARQRYHKDIERSRELGRLSYYRNRGNNLERGARYRADHPEAFRAYSANRRALKVIHGGSHSMADRKFVLRLQRNKCAYAGYGFEWCLGKIRGANAHWDHRVPLSRGGDNSAKNGQYLCRPCNIRKKASPEHEFLARSGVENFFTCDGVDSNMELPL